MLESMKFTYAGHSSDDMGVTMVNPDGGLYKDNFLPTRKIVEANSATSNAPYHKRVDDEPLSFSISFTIDDWGKRNSLRRIGRWMYQDYYEPLCFESDPHTIYYALAQGKMELTHNGLHEGYVTIPFRCKSANAFSDIKTYMIDVNGSTTTEFFNEGDRMLRPKLKITKRGNGNVSIRNNANGQDLIINDLYNGEVVTVDCSNEWIISSLEKTNNRYLLDNHNDIWLDFEPNYDSSTSFTFTGNFECEFSYEYIYLNESGLLEP